jgi:hypothetical protein
MEQNETCEKVDTPLGLGLYIQVGACKGPLFFHRFVLVQIAKAWVVLPRSRVRDSQGALTTVCLKELGLVSVLDLWVAFHYPK